ncbi:CinA family protein [Basilea psittacipulmonis]|uniref:CinA C-terminal domain-containing protein n=1 Tax=Basilea psittacipulmonis DSM 24701 TaxID=1072685 RepID=A0A077DC75_9BURK|nr:CinA family protein [Basilea psittacipulmonis]AIL32490.1 hypothetical protein IX83_03480 [Basilea psittacipulmonis DSM 24701]
MNQFLIHREERLKKLFDCLKTRHWCVGTAESCTGGLLAGFITSMAGSSQVFRQAVVTYSNESKQVLLSVDEADLRKYGAVSQEVARAMAKGVLVLDPKTNVAISTTGIAGPDGGTDTKPVGLVCFGFACGQTVTSCQKVFSGDRASIREQAVAFAIDYVLENLLKLD